MGQRMAVEVHVRVPWAFRFVLVMAGFLAFVWPEVAVRIATAAVRLCTMRVGTGPWRRLKGEGVRKVLEERL